MKENGRFYFDLTRLAIGPLVVWMHFSPVSGRNLLSVECAMLPARPWLSERESAAVGRMSVPAGRAFGLVYAMLGSVTVVLWLYACNIL